MNTPMVSAAKLNEIEEKFAQIMAGPDTLMEKLAAVRADRDSFVPAEITAVMDRAIDDLVRSGIRKSSLKPGDPLPAFKLPDIFGETIDTEALLQRGPLVVNFYRGSWCPYCNLELRALQQALSAIRASGASLVAVSAELPDRQAAMSEAHGIYFPLLHDIGNRVAKRFGIAYELPTDLLGAYQTLGHPLHKVNGPEGATSRKIILVAFPRKRLPPL
jgi:peroxiredoxin